MVMHLLLYWLFVAWMTPASVVPPAQVVTLQEVREQRPLIGVETGHAQPEMTQLHATITNLQRRLAQLENSVPAGAGGIASCMYMNSNQLVDLDRDCIKRLPNKK